uniref:Uncharacterized protein n=1 Tax=Glossina austeni TaxID=7395 RepID=A0A1A9UIR3_GLOAU
MDEGAFYYEYYFEIPNLMENEKNADRRTQSVSTIVMPKYVLSSVSELNSVVVIKAFYPKVLALQFSTTTTTNFCEADNKNFSIVKVFAGVAKKPRPKLYSSFDCILAVQMARGLKYFCTLLNSLS